MQVKAGGITNAMLAGSIANAKLANSAITINSNSTSLGSSVTLDTGDIAENGNLYFTNERVDDRVASLIVGGSNITATYDDAGNINTCWFDAYTDVMQELLSQSQIQVVTVHLHTTTLQVLSHTMGKCIRSKSLISVVELV